MKKTLSLIAAFLMLGPCAVTAQEVVDSTDNYSFPCVEPVFDSIFSMVQDKKSQYYYPNLTKRFMRADTTLGLQELRCLYYGYPVQKNFDPYERNSDLRVARSIMDADDVSTDDFKRAYKILEEGLAKKPSDLTLAYWKVIAAYYGYGEGSKQLDDSRMQFQMLQYATASSGMGTAEHPFFITTVGHSYTIMNIMGVRPLKQMLLYLDNYTCDAFPVVDEDNNEDTLYFEVSQCLKYWSFLDEVDEAPKVKQKSVGIDAGYHFVLKPRSIKRKESKFDIVLMERYNKPLDMSRRDSLFSATGEEGTIEGYFGYDADSTHTLLITKSRCSKSVDFDTKILYRGSDQWESTSNHGNWPGVVGVELWAGRISTIEISKLRRKK